MVVSLGSCMVKLDVLKTGIIVSTTTQQFSGLTTETKSVSFVVAVTVAPTAPFDQTKVGLAIVAILAVMTDEVQVAFWVNVTGLAQGEL